MFTFHSYNTKTKTNRNLSPTQTLTLTLNTNPTNYNCNQMQHHLPMVVSPIFHNTDTTVVSITTCEKE